MKATRLIVLTCFLFLCSNIVSAQSQENLKILFLDGEYFLMLEDYAEALNAYSQVYKKESDNANVACRIGLCYLNLPGQKTKAIPYLEYATANVSEKYTESTYQEKKAPPHSHFLLGTAYQVNYELDKAKASFLKYKSFLNIKDVYEIDFVDRQIEACNTAKKFMEEPVKIEKKIITGIPQTRPNFSPVLSANENLLLYCTEEKFYKAIWMIRKIGNRWTNPVNITSQLNSDGDCNPVSLSSDGTVLYLIRTSSYASDIYQSKFQKEKWSEIEKIDKPVNSKDWESHACITADGKTLYFTSNRKGGFGGLDIYKSSVNPKGKWGEPVNLGSVINTPFNEETPYITQDGTTLFFSSQGHQNMGGFDIFKSVSQSENNWSVPVNIGYPLNSTDDDLFFSPINNGERALYAGIMDESDNGPSIKEITIKPEHLVKQISIAGKIKPLDDLNEFDKSFIVKVVRFPEGDTIESIDPDMDGNFITKLIPGAYQLIVYADGYDTKLERLTIPEDFPRSEMNINIDLQSRDVGSGEYMIVKNIFFDYNSYELNEKALIDIERLYQVMRNYPGLLIEVRGHTDSKGRAEYNHELSLKRANAVSSYLVQKDIDPSRFITKGFGETLNIAKNKNSDGSDNPEGRKFNRNAEIRILQPENYSITIEPIEVPDYLKPVPYSVQTQEQSPNISKRPGKYGIQILAVRNPEGLKKIQRELKEITIFNGVDGYYRVTYGYFNKYSEAQAGLTKIKKDYPDAYIVKFDRLEKGIK